MSSYDRRTRGRFRVVHDGINKTLGVYFTDEGYSSLKLSQLKKMFPEYNNRSLRITGVSWPEFGEVVIHVNVRKFKLF